MGGRGQLALEHGRGLGCGDEQPADRAGRERTRESGRESFGVVAGCGHGEGLSDMADWFMAGSQSPGTATERCRSSAGRLLARWLDAGRCPDWFWRGGGGFV